MSLILSNTAGKSHLIHFIDTPGHINFVDEVASAIRLVDGILLVVDVVEGVCDLSTEGTKNSFSLLADGWHRVYPETRLTRGRQNYTGCKQDRQTYP